MDKLNHEKIYLVPDDGAWCWSDTPAPGAGQSNADAVEYVRADLFNQMQAERDALAAQAQALKTAAKFILDAKKPETKRKAYAALADAVNKTPQQHLANLRAEAGRAGFVAGFKLGSKTPKPVPENCHPAGMVDFVAYQIEKFANIKAHEYADSIRQEK